MLINATNTEFLCLPDEEAIPTSYARDAVMQNLLKISEGITNALDGINALLSDMPLLASELDDAAGYVAYEDVLRQILQFCESLPKRKDEIPPEVDLLTLQHLGYTPTIHNGLYEKVLEDNSARTVTEEVTVLNSGGHLHRKRTIEWTATPTGRASNSIAYEQLPINNELAVAIANTCHRPCCKCKRFGMSDRYEPICTAKKRCIHNSCERCDKFEPLTLPSPKKERRAEK